MTMNLTLPIQIFVEHNAWSELCRVGMSHSTRDISLSILGVQYTWLLLVIFQPPLLFIHTSTSP